MSNRHEPADDRLLTPAGTIRPAAPRTDPPSDAERAMIAREVHDRIGSGLALVLRRLELLEATARDLGPAERARLADVKESLVDTLGVAREIITALRRPVVAEVAEPARGPRLEPALRGFVAAMGPCGPAVRIGVEGDDGWAPQPVVDEVFVIVRESLRNVLAHAGARQVTAQISIAPHEIHALVVDDGTGFDTAPGRAAGRTNGLLGMQERARALDGTVTISSTPGSGTTVALWIPIKESSIRHD
ncbi:histidine kinase [Streptomyces sp. SL13]|uniref:Histidine kinase n=1 Tax=Streptantibioticus silvisoli TaxID=2705255 RepID=A0AA90KJE5_9ACTN|nr:histidine kinase [Streptantibioticus silvisoli]MDI5967001.1 histidine kinase [Streptantibioticus silvisoli]MDI5974520.1 histidine kinase [Streptantibioticus silvisoli]